MDRDQWDAAFSPGPADREGSEAPAAVDSMEAGELVEEYLTVAVELMAADAK